MKMRGHIGKGKCRAPGHGHSHMKGVANGYVCELTAEMDSVSRADEKREARREIDEDLGSGARMDVRPAHNREAVGSLPTVVTQALGADSPSDF